MMASEEHTYGPSCSLRMDSNTFTRRASVLSELPPKIRAQFFYSSALPIDDPLSPLPTPSSGSSSTPSKVPPRPFSVYDNAALEEAWQGLRNSGGDITKSEGKVHRYGVFCHDEKKETDKLFGERPNAGQEDQETVDSRDNNHTKIAKGVKEKTEASTSKDLGVGDKASKDKETSKASKKDKKAAKPTKKKSLADESLKPEEKSKLSNVETAPPLSAATPESSVKSGDAHLLLSDDLDHVPFDHALPVQSDEVDNNELNSEMSQKKHRFSFHRKEKASSPNKDDTKSSRNSSRHNTPPAEVQYGSSLSDTTGTPFLRAPSRSRGSPSPAHNTLPSQNDGADAASDGEGQRLSPSRPKLKESRSERSSSRKSESDTSPHGFSFRRKQKKAFVPVGISRLHLVEMPDLEMKPIYWSPVHDVSSVVRGTWFYKDTMMPVEADVANQLEEGYEYMKPWAQTYVDEVTSCLEIGPEAELKVVHKLWPPEEPPATESRPTTSKSIKILTKSPAEHLTEDEQARKHAVEVASFPENQAAGTFDSKESGDEPIRLYAKSSVIYANARDAQILRPGLLPSVARGRRPLGPIRKGRQIGVPVVRGFDHKAWEKIHPPKKGPTASMARAGANISQSGTAATLDTRNLCSACHAEEERPRATDLVLVIHGIGQKLSERNESFHFTHSINALRRQMNVELKAENIQPWLRPGLGGIMVLPINWRSTLILDDGGPQATANNKVDDSTRNEFTLKDITVDTIPAIRNLISDVILDIPYYLSHHRAKMVEAVIKEANRVYRLWCKNNPGFEKTGRVHLIAHSLGSVMALDILSKQPTTLPKRLDLSSKKVHDDMFEFDTTNLFLCGSPAGFFLLLNRASLIPRKGRNKPEADGEDLSGSIAGETGTYGCLAVDNIYNVMHYNDPIACRVNACVDVDYAASLQPASVPSATNSWLQAIGSVFRGKPAVASSGLTNMEVLPTRPTVATLPSTIEMETHNFSKEEIAEKKMFLLNDNGQIDFFLSSGGGPLEIQYLNMLGAHSSYWVLQDFVRFLVVEIGRKAGKEETVLGMRAVKKGWGKK